ncbi:MAG: hypothetical protein JXR76_01715 [Deltaproteobacteria bacterium]|nr:hypothetical protein [Deltaproteobacteria bacterium]
MKDLVTGVAATKGLPREILLIWLATWCVMACASETASESDAENDTTSESDETVNPCGSEAKKGRASM